MHRSLALCLLLPTVALAGPPLAIPAGDEPSTEAPPATPTSSAPYDPRGLPIGFDEVTIAPGFLGATFGATELSVEDVQQIAADAGYRAKPGADEGEVYAAYVIGGELQEGRCYVRPTGNACELGIRWRVVDAATDQVAYEVLSRGFVVEASGSRLTGRQAAVAAFRDLLARPGMRALVSGAAGPRTEDATPSRLDGWLAANPMDSDKKR
jgi:hypothetical protein